MKNSAKIILVFLAGATSVQASEWARTPAGLVREGVLLSRHTDPKGYDIFCVEGFQKPSCYFDYTVAKMQAEYAANSRAQMRMDFGAP